MAINWKEKYELSRTRAKNIAKHTAAVGMRVVHGAEVIGGNAGMNYMAHRSSATGDPRIVGLPAALVAGGALVIGGVLIKKEIGSHLAALGFGVASQYSGEKAAEAGAKARDAAAKAKTSGRRREEALGAGGIANETYANRRASVVR